MIICESSNSLTLSQSKTKINKLYNFFNNLMNDIQALLMTSFSYNS